MSPGGDLRSGDRRRMRRRVADCRGGAGSGRQGQAVRLDFIGVYGQGVL